MIGEQSGSTPAQPDRRLEPSPERESAWAAAIAQGDEAAFESLFLAYYDRLQLFALGFVRQADLAEDLVATVFTRLWEGRDRLRIQENVRSYLYTSVRHQALMYLQHRDVVDRVHGAAARASRSPGMGRPPPPADEQVQAAQFASAVFAAVERLPDRPREAYLLQRQHGLNYREIANVMGIHPKTVENHLGRALKGLRHELAEFLPNGD